MVKPIRKTLYIQLNQYFIVSIILECYAKRINDRDTTHKYKTFIVILYNFIYFQHKSQKGRMPIDNLLVELIRHPYRSKKKHMVAYQWSKLIKLPEY